MNEGGENKAHHHHHHQQHHQQHEQGGYHHPHHPHEQEGQMQGWEMHPQYQYARMSPSDGPPPQGHPYGSHPHQMMQGTGAGSGVQQQQQQHSMMNPGGAGGGGYMPYPTPHGHHMMHPSYGYPPHAQQQQQQQQSMQQQQQQQQSMHPGNYYGHVGATGPYYGQHYHPHNMSQYARSSPHPMESDYDKNDPAATPGAVNSAGAAAQQQQAAAAAAYYGYGGYMPPHHPGDQQAGAPAGYGMMHPMSEQAAAQHHSSHSMEMAKPPQQQQQHPHHPQSSHGPPQRVPSFEQQHAQQHHPGSLGGPPPSMTAEPPDYPPHLQQEQQLPHGGSSSAASDPMLQPSSSGEHQLSLESSVVKTNPSDDATIATNEAQSPPSGASGATPPPSSATQHMGSTSKNLNDTTRTPESNDAPSTTEEPQRQEQQSEPQPEESDMTAEGKTKHSSSTEPVISGSCEKKQTLDTASVLLAFSSTKKPRPSSETSMMMDDNDSKGSFPTLPTEPSFSSMISEPPTDHPVLPLDYPKRLKTPDDEEKLNALHCYMRSDLLEIVVIQPTNTSSDKGEGGSSAATPMSNEARNTPTSTDPQMIGRVGLRCVFCAMSPDGGRAGPSMSIFYPRTVSEIYRLVTSWKRCHLSKCRNLPPNVRQNLDGFRECRARGKTAYWIDSARAIGLVDIPTKIGGVRFQTDSAGNILKGGSSGGGGASAASPASHHLSLQSSESKPDDKELTSQDGE